MQGGDRLYARLIQTNTTLPMTADEVHNLGLSEVARIRGEMDEIRRRTNFTGDLAAFFTFIRTDRRFEPQSREWLRDNYYAIGRRVDARIREIFSTIPRSPLEIREVEAFRERNEAGGSYQDGSPDGTRPGIFYYNAYDLPSRRTSGNETLYLHEGAPGHHFQIMLAAENEALPAFMRFGGNTAYVEGWALYAETLWDELGMETDPYQRFGGLNDEMLRAMRLVVDTGIHAKGWTREQAIRYMLDNSGMSETEVTAEVERYIAIPGQALAYKVGQLTILRLRAEAERELGAALRPQGVPRPGADDRGAAHARARAQDPRLDREPARRLGFARQRLGDQLPAVLDPVEGDEAAHARALAGAEQGFVLRLEPVAQDLERVRLADFVDLGLDGLGVGIFGQRRQPRVEIAERRRLDLGRGAVEQRIGDEVAEISEREIEQPVELGMALGRGLGAVTLHEAPEQMLVVGRGDGDEVQQQREADRHPRRRHLARMDVVDRVAEALLPFLPRIGGEELLIFVDRLGDDAEAQLLRLPRVAVDVEGEALLRRVGQPFVDGDAVALGLRDLLAILVEEHLVVEALGRAAPRMRAIFELCVTESIRSLPDIS